MRILSLVLALLVTTPASAHEFWLEPTAYQVAPDGNLEATIVNGQNFEGVVIAYFPQRFIRFDVVLGNAIAPVEGRMGNNPALQSPNLGEGLNIVAYQSTNATVTYEDWAKFARFADHKGFVDYELAHNMRALPMENFKEVYSRYVKALIGVGNSSGADTRVGLETEFVALDNPYTDDLSNGMRLQLFYGDQVRANTQIEVFEKPLETAETPVLYQTDSEGIATIQVLPGHSYLVNAVVLREPGVDLSLEFGAVWETLWASMTFAIPD